MDDTERSSIEKVLEDLDDALADMETSVTAVQKIRETIADILVDDDPQGPVYKPLNLKVDSVTSHTITVSWDPVGGPYVVSRDGQDSTGYGSYSAMMDTTNTTTTFLKLRQGYAYNITVSNSLVTETKRVSTVSVPVIVSPPAASGTWNSGAYATGHNVDELRRIQAARKKPLGHVAVFPTRDQGAAGLASTWWMPPKDIGTMISVAVPMAYKDGSLNDNLVQPLTAMAQALKADGRTAIIRLGWEMNLPGWAWKCTEANLSLWRARWSLYYDLFKGILGDKAQIGLNPNVGRSQTGMSGDWVELMWVPGKVDWCGPDTYDCWPPMTSEANVRTQWSQPFGWDWWSAKAIAKNVPLAIPEWGVASGTQWAGNQGMDNPRFIQEMRKFLDGHVAKGGKVLLEGYFHDTDSYLKSDFSTNPKSGAAYNQLFGGTA